MGPPPPARLDHAMCSVLLPVSYGGADKDSQLTGRSCQCNTEMTQHSHCYDVINASREGMLISSS